MGNDVFTVGISCRRARTSRFQVIGGVKAKKFFGGLVLSYCSLSSAIPGPYLKGRDLTSHAERGFRKRSASPRALDQGAHCTSSSEPDIQNSAAGCKSSLVNLRFYTYSSLAPSCYNRCNRRIRPILNSWQLVPNTNELRFLKSLTVNHLFQTRTLFVL